MDDFVKLINHLAVNSITPISNTSIVVESDRFGVLLVSKQKRKYKIQYFERTNKSIKKHHLTTLTSYGVNKMNRILDGDRDGITDVINAFKLLFTPKGLYLNRLNSIKPQHLTTNTRMGFSDSIFTQNLKIALSDKGINIKLIDVSGVAENHSSFRILVYFETVLVESINIGITNFRVSNVSVYDVSAVECIETIVNVVNFVLDALPVRIKGVNNSAAM
jgi:hypothetical protein